MRRGLAVVGVRVRTVERDGVTFDAPLGAPPLRDVRLGQALVGGPVVFDQTEQEPTLLVYRAAVVVERKRLLRAAGVPGVPRLFDLPTGGVDVVLVGQRLHPGRFEPDPAGGAGCCLLLAV